MTSLKIFVFTFLLFSFAGTTSAQKAVTFKNPSFEGMPRHSQTPQGWVDCGFPHESPPDIQPNYTFQVSTPASDGQSYLGMVVRDNETWESVGTELSQPLEQGKCYEFQIDLARSPTYLSTSRKENRSADYTTPTKLRIWGGSAFCDKKELLAVSPLIKNSNWEKHTYRIRPQSGDIEFIVLEVYYENNLYMAYNGNILLDNASPFIPVEDCNIGKVRIEKAPINGNPGVQINIREETMEIPAGENIVFEKRTLPAASIDSEVVCELLEAFTHSNSDRTLLNLSGYVRQFNTKRWIWTIVLTGDNKRELRKTRRELQIRIDELNLKSYLKITDINDLDKDAVNLCIRPLNTGSIGIYY